MIIKLPPTLFPSTSFDEFLRLEVLLQVEDLSAGETQEADHGKDGEVEDARVGRLVRIAHLFLARAHVSKVIHDRLRQILQTPQLQLTTKSKVIYTNRLK